MLIIVALSINTSASETATKATVDKAKQYEKALTKAYIEHIRSVVVSGDEQKSGKSVADPTVVQTVYTSHIREVIKTGDEQGLNKTKVVKSELSKQYENHIRNTIINGDDKRTSNRK